MSPSSSIRDFAQYAGRFLWPRNSSDLTDTTICPACRTLLPSAVCPTCGLDLRHPAARDLLNASTDAAAALDKRVQLIGQIRYEVAEAHGIAAADAQRRALEQAAAQTEAAERAQRAAQAARTAAAQQQVEVERTRAEAEAQRAAALKASTAAEAGAALASAPPASPTVAAPAPARIPESAAAAAAAAAAASASASAEYPQPVAAGRPGSTTPPPPPAEQPTGPAPHKRSSVQIVLLLVGVTLVSIAAIVFVTVAFIFTGLAFRAGVVGVLTLGTLLTAALLRRKGLVATAEGIGALAVVLVLLDVWALRQLNLFGLGDGDGLFYWGGALSVCTVLFLGWHAASSLRVASVAGFAAAAPAVGLLAAGIAADADPLTRLFVAAIGAAAGALVHRFTLPGSAGVWPSLDRRAERGALLTLAGLAVFAAAGLAGLVEPDTAWAPLLSFGVVAIVAAAHAFTVLVRPRPGIASRVAAHAFVASAALAGVLGVLVTTVRSESLTLLVSVPLLVAVLVALGFELAWRRTPAGTVRTSILTGGLTVAALMFLIGAGVVIVAAFPLLQVLSGFDTDTGPIARPSSESIAALTTLAGAAVLVAVFWRIGGVLNARRHLLAWFGLAVLLLAVPFTQLLWLILPLYLLLGALALAALFLARSSRPELVAFRPELLALFIAAEALGYTLGWHDSSSWWFGTLSAVAALVLARLLLNRITRSGSRGALLAGAIVLTLIGVAAAPRALTLAAPPTDAVLLLHVALALALTVGVLAVFVAQNPYGTLTPLERRWAFWTLLLPTLYVVIAPTGRLLEALPAAERATVALLAPAAGVLATALVVAATLLWALLPAPSPDGVLRGGSQARTAQPGDPRADAALANAAPANAAQADAARANASQRNASDPNAPQPNAAEPAGGRPAPKRSSTPSLRWERLIAALLVAPALLALAVNLVLVTDAPAAVALLVAPTATLLTAALALTLRVTSGPSRVGLALELGAALVLATAFARLDLNDLGWLVLLLTGVAVLLTAIDADGLFASGSWRRHLGWISLALATAGLWWGLGNSGTTPLEAYLLPVAGTVLALAALLWRYGAVDRTVAASPGAALLTLAGLSLALLPLAVTGQTGSVLRPILVGTVSAILLLGAALIRWTAPRWAFLAAAGLAGAAALLTTGIARSLRVLSTGGPAAALLEAWLLPTVAILVAAALLVVRQDHAPSRLARHRTGVVLALIALTTLTVLESIAFDTTGLGAGRAIGLVLLLSALHVVSLWRPTVPFGLVTAFSSAGLAGVAVLAALFSGAVDPFEAVVVPLGLALITGQLLLNRPWSPGAGRSAPAAQYWIGLGLALTLLPSAAVAAAPGASSLAAGLTDDALRQLLTIVLGGLLAVGGAVLLGRSRWSLVAWPAILVGAATILITAAGRILPLLSAGRAGADWRVEAWLVPAALLLVVSGGLVIRAFPAGLSGLSVNPADAAPGSATAADASIPRGFGYGLVTLALLGILTAEIGALSFAPYAVGRALALIGLFAVLHVVLRWFDRSRPGALLAWFTLAAGGLALFWGMGRDLVNPLELGTVTVGLSLVAGQLIAAGMVGRAPTADATTPGTRVPGAADPGSGRALPTWLGVGLGLAVLPSAVESWTAGSGAAEGWSGDLLRPILTLVTGGLLVIGGALLVTRPRWSALVWPSIVVGTAALVVTARGRIQPLLAETPVGPNWQLELWLLPTALLLIAAGALVILGSPVALPRITRVPASRGAGPVVGSVAGPGPVTGMGPNVTPEAWPGDPRRALGYGLVLLALFGILAVETGALGYPPYAQGRMIALIALFTVLHVVVRWYDRSAAGAMLAWCTIVAGVLALVSGQARDLPSPLEIGTVPLGLALVVGQLIVLGVLGRRPDQPAAGAGSGLAPASSRPARPGVGGASELTSASSRPAGRGRQAGQGWLAVGLALALLPSAVEGTEGSLLRPVLSLSLGGAVGILGALLLTRTRWNVLAWPACLVGIVAVLLTGGLRIVPLYDGPTGPTGELEAWLIPAALLLVATGACLVWTTWTAASAYGTATALAGDATAGAPGAEAPGTGATGAPGSNPTDPDAALRTGPDRAVWAGYGLAIAALVGVVLAELPALDYASLATIRVVLVVWLFSALYLGVFWADESRLGRLVAWVAIGGAAVMVVAGWAHEVPDPVEIITVPLALALVASGLLHLDRFPAARSWITLAPGLLVLLVPSLFLDLTYSPVWRVVGLGVITIAVLVLGTVRRLQAPFLIGAAVLLVHALAQLWPWISAAYGVVPWWLWLGIGGVLLIVLAARYEQRIQNLKTVALRISALR